MMRASWLTACHLCINTTLQIPQACRDLGWLAFSPALRRAMEEARAAVDAAVGAAAAAPAGGEGTDDAGVGGEAPMRFCVKLNAYPKSLEHVAAELMLEGRCAGEYPLALGMGALAFLSRGFTQPPAAAAANAHTCISTLSYQTSRSSARPPHTPPTCFTSATAPVRPCMYSLSVYRPPTLSLDRSMNE